MPSLRQKANNNQTRCEESDEKKNAQGIGVITISTARSESAHSEKEEEGRCCRCLGLLTTSKMQEDDLVLAGVQVELKMERLRAVRCLDPQGGGKDRRRRWTSCPR